MPHGLLDDLRTPWRAAFDLAWEAYQAGSPPVGSVIVDSNGAVMATGRSRRSEASAPAGQIAGSRLAHAEVNALAQLPVDHDASELYVTLEPCLLCWAAISITHVPRVFFAGSDPVWSFLGSLADVHPALSERAYAAEGPLAGPIGTWATLLALTERLWRDPKGLRVEHFTRSVPALVKLADRLVSNGTAKAFLEISQEEALSSVWDDLVASGAASGPPSSG
ncbi:MAG TPA: deaminase [Acidimicrobiales bacterium]|nr:deaminase [Acidimicrobiales bacterium]